MVLSPRHLNGTLGRNIVLGHLSYYVLALLVHIVHYFFLNQELRFQGRSKFLGENLRSTGLPRRASSRPSTNLIAT
jgi:hypothetical protein